MLRPSYNILLISPGWTHLWHTVTESAGGKSQVIFQTGKQVQRTSKCGFPELGGGAINLGVPKTKIIVYCILGFPIHENYGSWTLKSLPMTLT